MADHFVEDWSRFGMDVVYPFPETLLRVSHAHMARHRLLGFNLIRSNPKICGFNLTGMLDHALPGRVCGDSGATGNRAPLTPCRMAGLRYDGACLSNPPMFMRAVVHCRGGGWPMKTRCAPVYLAPISGRGARNGLAWERQSTVRIPA